MSRRSELRAQAFEIAGNRCEHPILVATRMRSIRCPTPATELAHIVPRGMGHTGYRDTLPNVMAACPIHARSTDDLSSEEWRAVPAPGGRLGLASYVNTRRRAEGVDLERSDP